MWYWGMFGSMGLAAVLMYYKPDTRYVLILYSYLHSFLTIFIPMCKAFRLGLLRRRRRAWKHEERTWNTNRHSHLQEYLSYIITLTHQSTQTKHSLSRNQLNGTATVERCTTTGESKDNWNSLCSNQAKRLPSSYSSYDDSQCFW